MAQIRHYIDENGSDIIAGWLSGLRDYKAREAVDRRIRRMEMGNLGDCKPLRDGVWEFRIDVGPGYRVYFAKDGSAIVLLLCGGDKRRQNSDIDRACGFWRDWQQRKKRRAGNA